MVPNAYVDNHSAKSVRHQNRDSVNFQCADNQAVISPVLSATEPNSQPGRLKDNIGQNRGCEERVMQGDTGPQRTDYNGDIAGVNATEIQHTVQRKSHPPVSSYNAVDEYVEPSAERARHTDNVGRKESSRRQEQTPMDNDNYERKEVFQGDGRDEVHSRAVTDKARVTANVKSNEPIVILQATAGSKVWHSVDAAVENSAAMPHNDSIFKRRISDARRRESVDRSLNLSFASSISHGEVIANIEDTTEWSDIDTMAEDAVAMSVYDSTFEGMISEARRRQSTDKSLYAMQPSFATSISNDEVIANTQGTMDLLQTQDQSLVLHATNCAASKTVDQPPLNPGT